MRVTQYVICVLQKTATAVQHQTANKENALIWGNVPFCSQCSHRCVPYHMKLLTSCSALNVGSVVTTHWCVVHWQLRLHHPYNLYQALSPLWKSHLMWLVIQTSGFFHSTFVGQYLVTRSLMATKRHFSNIHGWLSLHMAGVINIA
jgi:hypothetical protein